MRFDCSSYALLPLLLSAWVCDSVDGRIIVVVGLRSLSSGNYSVTACMLVFNSSSTVSPFGEDPWFTVSPLSQKRRKGLGYPILGHLFTFGGCSTSTVQVNKIQFVRLFFCFKKEKNRLVKKITFRVFLKSFDCSSMQVRPPWCKMERSTPRLLAPPVSLVPTCTSPCWLWWQGALPWLLWFSASVWP